jgi:hypothetical protein
LFSGFYVGTMLVNIFMQLYLMHRMRTQLHWPQFALFHLFQE